MISQKKSSLVDSNFKPRPYQLELLDKSIEKNMIIYLQTGSGKTFIAVMLIRELSNDVLKEFDEGGKRTIFLAHTVPLVKQQAAVLMKHTHLNVGHYFKDKKIDDKLLDFWDKSIWNKEFQNYHILVMTPQILVNLLQHAYLDINRINLLIFDESHHATGNHMYSQILRFYKNNDSERKNIRILGLTASIVQKKCNLKQFNIHFKELEERFCCRIETAIKCSEDEDGDLKKLFNKPILKTIQYSSVFERESIFFEMLEEIKSLCKILESKLDDLIKEDELLKEQQEAEAVDLKEINANEFPNELNPYKILKKEFHDLQIVLVELGLWCFRDAYIESMRTLETAISLLKDDKWINLKGIESFLDSIKTNFSLVISKFMPSEDSDVNVLNYSSEKLNCLASILKNANDQENQNNSNKEPRAGAETDFKFHSIVFVERKKIAFHLDGLFKRLSKSNDDYAFLQTDYVYGTVSATSKDAMNDRKQDIAIGKFRSKEINVLIATNIIEEGVDIPSCNMVIRYSMPHNFGSYIQSKGRARSINSSYYMLIDEQNRDKCIEEITNFVEIENDIDKNLANKVENDDGEEIYTEDELKLLDREIPPYKKGNSEITCHTAIGLINRYCSNLEQSTCSVLYPTYKISEASTSSNTKMFCCKLWLPPNSVVHKEVESRYFKRKKWAKMDAAMKMCIELDKADQLTDNLTILTKEQWVKQHYDFKEDEQEDEKNKKKVGTSKNKREYDVKIAEELMDNHAKPNKILYLYAIEIIERDLSPTADDQTGMFLDKSISIGYLNSKFFQKVPTFKLNQSNKEFEVSIRNLKTSLPIQINQDQFVLLKNINESIFIDLLRFKIEMDFEKSIYGGFIVILKKSLTLFDSFEIDWDFMKSCKKKINLNEYLKSGKSNFDQLVVRLDADPTLNEIVKNQVNRLFSIESFNHKLNPLSKFAKSEFFNFKEFYAEKYKLETSDLTQPLVQLTGFNLNMNFILKVLYVSNKKNKASNSKEVLFIPEHLFVLPFTKSYSKLFSMIPAIFHRMNCLKKVEKFKLQVESFLTENLKLKKVENDLSWNESIKFNKIKESIQPPSLLSDDEDESTASYQQDLVLDRKFVQDTKANESPEQDEAPIPPPLLIKEHNLEQTEYTFPNVYQIFQCLTLKSANENFDLERYEIMGDCFLKLAVVMKIYSDFTKTNEGNMAELKSKRVGNRYLFRLAMNKSLNEFINSENFQPKLNWLMPNLKPVEMKELVDPSQIDLNKFKFKISDKSCADAIEALIGCYLITLGQTEAYSFLRWLDFKVSNKEGSTVFNQSNSISDPLLSKFPKSIDLKIYENFAKTLNYKFNNIAYLYQAFTHPSYTKNRYTGSYQKLEFVGDAVIDILVTQFIFSDKKEHSPGELTELRQALVNNKFFAHLSVKHNFTKYLNYENRDIFNKLNEYLKHHEIFSPDLAYFNNENENQNSDLDQDQYDYEAPKFLADIFESVAGAIYLDSNCSLDAVWRVYYPILKPYLVRFKENPPQSPISAFKKLKPNAIIKKLDSNSKNETETETEPETETETEATFIIEVDGFVFEGTGTNKLYAKNKAYKKAIKHFFPNEKIIFF